MVREEDAVERLRVGRGEWREGRQGGRVLTVVHRAVVHLTVVHDGADYRAPYPSQSPHKKRVVVQNSENVSRLDGELEGRVSEEEESRGGRRGGGVAGVDSVDSDGVDLVRADCGGDGYGDAVRRRGAVVLEGLEEGYGGSLELLPLRGLSVADAAFVGLLFRAADRDVQAGKEEGVEGERGAG